ncbi:threonine-phosphate decarboxylase CobD [Crocosphaera chwakensis]|uniref:threonine-phosphate decarboxylase n=1 Tax=Crocosphaera chwakensis CCY0110 TaxID=391612 RepID=A3IRS0_9CHRO|nr:threonine-phosphate decarboxylase CobD [Crocosphaera chwakensis]EAZ90771.1 histidinol-phosphate aminotransferase [Crocosphaera chwakensis CCY0110]
MKQPIHGGNLVWAAAQIGCPVSSIVDFSASINPLGPPQSVLAAIQTALDTLKHYPDPYYLKLRQALSQWHQLPSDWILPGNGAAELLTWAGRELAQEQQTYVMTPGFRDYWRGLQAFGATITPISFPWQTANCFDLLDNCPETDAGIIINNPHNPTGKLFTTETLLSLLERFNLVVVDEAFMDFVPPSQQQSLIPVIEDYPNLVILRSLTKFYSLPGLRLGYAIAHPHRLQQWQTWRDPWPVNSLAVHAGIAAIQDEAFTQQTRQWLLSAYQQLFTGLSQIQGLEPIPSSVNFILVKTQIPSSQLQLKLLQKYRILIRDCLSFETLGDRYFRIAVRTVEDNNKLLEGLLTIFS